MEGTPAGAETADCFCIVQLNLVSGENEEEPGLGTSLNLNAFYNLGTTLGGFATLIKRWRAVALVSSCGEADNECRALGLHNSSRTGDGQVGVIPSGSKPSLLREPAFLQYHGPTQIR